MVEDRGFPAGYQKVSLEVNLNATEMGQAAVDIHAVSSLPLILDGPCRYGDPIYMHCTIGMSLTDPSTPLLADGFGIKSRGAPDWAPTEKAMLSAIDLEELLAVERATVKKGKR
jgi:hypothetical protein